MINISFFNNIKKYGRREEVIMEIMEGFELVEEVISPESPLKVHCE